MPSLQEIMAKRRKFKGLVQSRSDLFLLQSVGNDGKSTRLWQVRIKTDNELCSQQQARKEESDPAEILTVPSKRTSGNSEERAKKPRSAAQLAYTSFVRHPSYTPHFSASLRTFPM